MTPPGGSEEAQGVLSEHRIEKSGSAEHRAS